MRRYEHTTHGIEPVFDQNSRVLILGSLPSVKSREMGFYYGNPRNRFWPVLAAIAHEPEPIGIADRRRFLLKHRIALWDVVSSCDIVGSSDSSIRNVVPNDIAPFLEQGIERIFANGQTARAL